MSDHIITGIVTLLTAIIGVAVIATLVSKQAQTGQVIQAGSQGFASILTAALTPVAGSQGFGNLAGLGGGGLNLTTG